MFFFPQSKKILLPQSTVRVKIKKKMLLLKEYCSDQALPSRVVKANKAQAANLKRKKNPSPQQIFIWASNETVTSHLLS